MNLLITGAWQQANRYIPELEKKGYSVRFLEWEKEDLPCEPDWVEGIVGNGVFLTHPIESFTNLRFIQLTSAGFDRVPMEYVKEHEIQIYNARGVYSIPMAEFALTGVLTMLKEYSLFYENQKAHKWEKNRNLKELYGRVVCILGCGSVGTECAKRFEAMGCKVLGIDPVVKESEFFADIYHTDETARILGQADIVIITLPLTDQTRHVFNKQLLAAMKDDAVLVNIARGAIIDELSLIEEMKEKRIRAVLDVFEEEPLSESSPLWSMENVIVTPHNSFVGERVNQRMSDVVLNNLERYSSSHLESEK